MRRTMVARARTGDPRLWEFAQSATGTPWRRPRVLEFVEIEQAEIGPRIPSVRRREGPADSADARATRAGQGRDDGTG